MRNQVIYEKIKENWDSLIKPLDALGDFEEISCKMGAVLADTSLYFRPALIVFCADNGIIDEGVSQSDESVTYQVTRLLGMRKSSVCHMAQKAGVDVYPVNLGVKQSRFIGGVDNGCYVSAGTSNFAVEPAMTEVQFATALENGSHYVEVLCKDRGYNAILLGEMGIGNTTTATAVIAAALGCSISEICGRGSGLDDAGLTKKAEVIQLAIEKYNLTNADAKKILSHVGGYDIVAMTGAILKANELSIPVVLDGLITCAAALMAYQMDESVADVLVFSHKGREKGIMTVADYFKVKPVIDGNLALGEGTGAVMFMDLLETAISVYKGKTTFMDASVEAYRRFS